MVSQFVGNVDPEVDAAGEDARATPARTPAPQVMPDAS
jgi:hypothetical protein